MIGKLIATSLDMRLKMDGGCELVALVDKLSTNDAKQLINACEGLDKKLTIAVDTVKKQRSLDANSFMWTLCKKIADKIGSTKDLVYQKFIKEVGSFEITPIKDIAVSRWLESWNGKGTGWLAEIVSDSKIEGYTNIINYYGSSSYDTKEMSILINEVVNSCKELDIPTETPAELARLCESWGK